MSDGITDMERELESVVKQLSKGFTKGYKQKPQYPIHVEGDNGCQGGNLEYDNVPSKNFDYETILPFIPRSSKERPVGDLMQIGVSLYRSGRADFVDMEELGMYAKLRGTSESKLNKFYLIIDNICNNQRN